ncbi:MAG: glycosyltransferase family 1 protein [Pseudomonadota bacterium]
MHVLVVTDAWHPQVNGVVRSYERLAEECPKFGAEISFLAPSQYYTLPCPTYPEIRLALATPGMVDRYIKSVDADFVHIATEGPLGMLARRHCRRNKRPFTTSYHTRFPEYISARLPIPEAWAYSFQRKFHNSGAGMFVAAPSVEEDLAAKGFERMMRWTRGVDVDLFRPRDTRHYGDGPVFMYIGRVSVEKNIEAFLKLDLPGRKVVVGGGPQLSALERAYPDVLFTGAKEGEDLAEAYASGDVFVFPSLTDTFGLVLLEALACGMPVAAYPVHGPKDVLTDPACGVLDNDLRAAAIKAMDLSRDAARAHALKFSWENSAQQFLDNVLAAHNLGLPERQRLLTRLNPKRLIRRKNAA